MPTSSSITAPADSTKAPRKRRRWLSYSLRALLVLITVFGVWLGIKVDQARRQKRAVETLRALGAEIAYEHQRVKNGFDTKIDLGVPVWARELCGDDFFQTVRLVAFWPRVGDKPGEPLPHEIADADLACLADLPHIERLAIWNAPISAEGLEHLPNPERLKEVQLTDTKVGDDFVRRLKGAKDLESLDLSNSPVTDDGLAELDGMTDVIALRLHGTQTGDRGLAAFRRCSNLVILMLGSQTTDEGLQQFRRLDALDSLYAGGSRITGHAFRDLRLSKADQVQLSDCPISDSDLPELVRAIEDVRAVLLNRTSITDDGLRHLSKLGKTEILILYETKIEGRELKQLSSLPRIQWINLHGCPLNNPDLKALEPLYTGLAPGINLSLDKTPITDDDLAKISGFTNLIYLGLSHTKITDAGLSHLYKLAKLAELDLRGTQVTADGVKKLKRAIGGAKVAWDVDPMPGGRW